MVEIGDHMEYGTKPSDRATAEPMARQFWEKNWVQIQKRLFSFLLDKEFGISPYLAFFT